jgi:hypothetical protein
MEVMAALLVLAARRTRTGMHKILTITAPEISPSVKPTTAAPNSFPGVQISEAKLK